MTPDIDETVTRRFGPLSRERGYGKSEIALRLRALRLSAFREHDMETGKPESAGVHGRIGRYKITIHGGPNRLSHTERLQAGIQLNGSKRLEYALVTIWVGYRTLHIGPSWSKREVR